LRTIFGGGLGVFIPTGVSPEVGLQLSLGVEVLLDSRTGIFLDGEYFYAFGGGRFGRTRTVLGANLR